MSLNFEPLLPAGCSPCYCRNLAPRYRLRQRLCRWASFRGQTCPGSCRPSFVAWYGIASVICDPDVGSHQRLCPEVRFPRQSCRGSYRHVHALRYRVVGCGVCTAVRNTDVGSIKSRAVGESSHRKLCRLVRAIPMQGGHLQRFLMELPAPCAFARCERTLEAPATLTHAP
jgi:hypothetical protein